jgi:hypothetical protein
MKQSAILFFVCIFFLFPLLESFSEENFFDKNLIVGIKIEGLQRTNQSVAEESLHQFLGKNAESIDFDDVRGAILGLGILDPQEVKIEDADDGSGKILCVSVEEKWSIFPIPVFFLNSDGYRIGAMFMDSNAFGVNDKFVVGGMYGTSGWLAMLMFFHQGREGLPGWNLSAFYSNEKQEHKNQDDKNIRKFQLDSVSVSAGLSFDFNDFFSSNAALSFYWGDISQPSSSFAIPKDDGSYINARIGSEIDQEDWDGYFLSQKSLSASFEYSYGIESSSYYTFQIKGDFEQSLFPGLKGFVKSAFVFSPDSPPLFESSPSSANIDILPNSFAAKNYLGGSAGFEKSLFSFSMGTLSAFASYQIVYSDGPILGEHFDHGIASGIRFYMKKLAIPALGVGISYNVAASYFQAYFSLGMGF